MAAMLNFRSLGIGLPWFLGGGSAPYSSSKEPHITLPSVEIHDIEERPEKRARTLKHLVKLNHVNHSIIYHDLHFHNHTPHVLGSAYLLGASPDQMTAIYEEEAKHLEAWVDSPGEVSKEDWRDFLGKRNYQRAFVDFFEDQLVQHGYDWKDLVNDFLYEGKEPLINSLVAGLGHPLIHLGYAFELSSRTIAIEALALVTCFYDSTNKYLNDPSYIRPSPWSSTSPLEILDKMATDARFDGLFTSQGEENATALMEDKEKESLMLEYWNCWTIEDPDTQFEQSQKAAAALLVGSVGEGEQYDFFLVHLLTSSHAVRVLLPLVPAKWHLSLVRQWWLFVVTAYISQLRPRIHVSRIKKVELQGKGWKFVDDVAVNGRWSQDAHFVKGCRSLKEAANTWEDADNFFLKAAVKFAEDFDGWGGFGSMSADDAEHHAHTSGHRPSK